MYTWIKKRKELFLILSFVFYVAGSKIIKLTWRNNYKNLGLYFSCTFVVFLLLFLFLGFIGESPKHIIKKYGIFIVVCFLLGISAIFCGNIALFINAVFLLALGDISFDKILKYYLYSGVISLIIIFLLCRFEILYDYVVDFGYGVGHSYGLSHPNNLAGYIFSLVTVGWYLYGNKRDYFSISMILVAAYLSITLMASRTICISLIILALGVVCKKMFSKLSGNVLQALTIIGFIFVIFLSFLLTAYNATIFKAFENIDFLYTFLYRFADGTNEVNHYGITLFGNKLSPDTIFDLSYIRLLVEFGVVASVLHYLIVIKGIINCKGDYRLLLIICIFMLIGFMETSVYYIFYNPYLLLAFCKVGNEDSAVKTE